MTAAEGLALEKRFKLWRAGLLQGQNPADVERDIERHLDALRIIECAPGTSRPLPPRVLTNLEREAYREGRLIQAQIVREDVLRAHEATRAALERSKSTMRATRAENEARRLTAEAQRWRDSSA
jgi:hypothetical protein